MPPGNWRWRSDNIGVSPKCPWPIHASAGRLPSLPCPAASLSPGGKRNALPDSPLYRRHRVPVSIRVGAAAPVFMSSNNGDSALPQITLTLRDSKASHLDSLTLVIHQRADLQSIPLAFRVPITRRVPQELFAGLGG